MKRISTSTHPDVIVETGDTVILEKGGDVIPKGVEGVLEERPADSSAYVFPSHCPVCQGKLVRDEDEAASRCENPSCPAQLKRRLQHFASRNAMFRHLRQGEDGGEACMKQAAAVEDGMRLLRGGAKGLAAAGQAGTAAQQIRHDRTAALSDTSHAPVASIITAQSRDSMAQAYKRRAGRLPDILHQGSNH